jgi:hypothetical protein
MEESVKRKLAWAEHSMEMYMRQNNKAPLRSSIPVRGKHVHSSEWLEESASLLRKEYDSVL